MTLLNHSTYVERFCIVNVILSLFSRYDTRNLNLAVYYDQNLFEQVDSLNSIIITKLRCCVKEDIKDKIIQIRESFFYLVIKTEKLFLFPVVVVKFWFWKYLNHFSSQGCKYIFIFIYSTAAQLLTWIIRDMESELFGINVFVLNYMQGS